MKKDLERIRKMAAEGTISAAQAEKLIASMNGSEPAAAAPSNPASVVRDSRMSIVRLGLAIAGVVLMTGTGVLAVNNSVGCPGTVAADRADQACILPDDQVVGQGEMVLLKDGKKFSLPLRHTDVKGTIEGTLARVTVQQRFVNVMTTPIEAVYTFPLPSNAAVDSMVMAIGDRRIRGIIKERGEARAIYEQARRDGKTASLLEQERPNIFTQSVANIMPGDTIDVTISYVEEVAYRNGVYQVVFPMVVGPRYIPGESIKPPQAGGTVGPTAQVSDADRITPAIVPKGMRSGADISLAFTIRGGKRLAEVNCESHRTTVKMEGDSGATVSIISADNIPNKDFILRYRLAEKTISSLFLTHAEVKDSGWFMLTMLPQIEASKSDIVSRELVFVIDNSGSMMGQPVAKCRQLMAMALEKMRPGDVFRILTFAGSTQSFRNEALPASDNNKKDALSFIDKMQGSGGTEMMSAIRALYELPDDPSRKRLILFMTDGYVGNEDALIATAREKLGRTRVFTLGVGSSVNHYLLESLASVGRGEYRFIRQDGDADAMVKDFYTLIDAPVLTDITVSVEGNIGLSNMVPKQLPDLFAGVPAQLTGRYAGSGNTTVTIRGMLPGGKSYEQRLDVGFAKPGPQNAVVKTLWARRTIKDLKLNGTGVYNSNGYVPDDLKEKITAIALRYKIMSEYTSFVAVDERIRNEGGEQTRVEQPVEMPEGVDHASQPPERIASGSMTMKAQVSSSVSARRGVASPVASAPEMKKMEREECDEQMSSMLASSKPASPIMAEPVLQECPTPVADGPDKDAAAKMKGSEKMLSKSVEKSQKIDAELEKLQKQLQNLDAGDTAIVVDAKEARAEALTPKFRIVGSRNEADVTAFIKGHLQDLEALYKAELRTHSGLAGSVRVKIVVDEKGSVILCEMQKSTLGLPSLEKAMIAAIKVWNFGKFGKKSEITEVMYTFEFAP